MSKNRIIGIAALVLALVAAYLGYNESQGLSSSFSSAVNGSPSDNVLMKYGIAFILGVIGLVLVKR